MEHTELGNYIVSDPAICEGKLTFKGTRVLVGPVLASFLNGKTIDDIVTKSWPTISRKAVEEALLLAICHLTEEFPGAPQLWHKELVKRVEKEMA